jgi:hypothetical protein
MVMVAQRPLVDKRRAVELYRRCRDQQWDTSGEAPMVEIPYNVAKVCEMVLDFGLRVRNLHSSLHVAAGEALPALRKANAETLAAWTDPEAITARREASQEVPVPVSLYWTSIGCHMAAVVVIAALAYLVVAG